MIGFAAGVGVNLVRQSIQIAEGAKDDEGNVKKNYDLTEALFSGVVGGVGAVAVTFFPGLIIPFTALGLWSGASEIAKGNYATGLFDIGTSLLPFKNAKVRGNIFGGSRTGKTLGWSNKEVIPVKQRYENLREFKLFGFGNGKSEVLQENPNTLKSEPRQLTDGGRSNQKLLGDNGVQERIESGKLLNAAPEEKIKVSSNSSSKVSKRLEYLGKTPSKKSSTGKSVISRMQTEGKVRVNPDGTSEVFHPDKGWVPIDENVDMGHIQDAVKYWNEMV